MTDINTTEEAVKRSLKAAEAAAVEAVSALPDDMRAKDARPHLVAAAIATYLLERARYLRRAPGTQVYADFLESEAAAVERCAKKAAQ